MDKVKQSHKRRGSSLAVQGAILALAGIIVRLIGFAYRVPLLNILGDEAQGYYGKAFEIYSFALIISSYGLPSAVAKIISARMAVKKYKEAHKVFISAMGIASIIGVLAFAIMYFGAEFLARLVYSENSVPAIRALSPTLLIFSLMAVLRGYFQGMNTMIPTAVSQIIEQLFNAIFSLVMASILIKQGLALGAAGGTLGTGIGALAGLITLICIYLLSRQVFLKRMNRDKHMTLDVSYGHISKLVIMTAVPIVIGSAAFHLTNFLDMIMINDAFRFHGYTEKAADTLYGVLTGKYKIIITLPISIASALAAATIPSITTSLVLKDRQQLVKKINLAIRFTMFVAIPACVGIFVLAEPILSMLFNDDHLELSTQLLQIGSISVVFFALSTISIGVLQGIDRLRVPVISSLKSLVIKMIFNGILLYALKTNLYGAVVTNIIFAFFSAYFNMSAIKRYTHIQFDIKKTYVIPAAAALIMGGICHITYIAIEFVAGSNTMATLLAILVSALTYVVALIKLKGVNKTELRAMPKGDKMVALLTKVRLLH
ncbi:polysaccharide biosynthesis protein [Vallitalea pronyensis]|uniref:Polysaccharide biosynthesis protein n=1 Tax=Vallitalea pronyensis TaxID=1348613 RepID=A0A8J8MLC8_9FIRM|nr:polysaccharide biosynthesis protein [Vallitalea pronyensis]QUI23527.1 polysaccharide biosynthesis protein [Vallitalea pronyensis]